MFIDTHCHLNMMVDKKRNDLLQPTHFPVIAEVVSQAHKVGVTKIINVGTTVNESLNSVELARRFEFVYATVGLHPCDVREGNWKEEFEKIKKLVHEKERHKIVGIGETGLDYFHQPFDKAMQHAAFRAHIELALTNSLPVVIHIREAADDALRVIEEYKNEIRGVNHCFAQQQYVADQLIAWGLALGIDAPITYPKNQWFRDIVQKLPLASVILETDAPFLPPQSLRGKQNSPTTVPLIAQMIAELQGVSLEKVAEITTQNAAKLFGI